MKSIVPHLWFNRVAEEAARFYTSLFDNSSMEETVVLMDTPSGDVPYVRFTLAGQPFEAIGAGDEFPFNPSVSLTVGCASATEADRLWEALSAEGTVRMPLGAYPFSERYGWVQDKYGLSWQIMLAGAGGGGIMPSLLLDGRAEEAARFYADVFPDSGIDMVSPIERGAFVLFRLAGQRFSAMDGTGVDFTFNEAVSFIVYCADQAEVDFYWEKLSHVPEAEACGWIKDKFGLSWQIVPARLIEMMASGDAAAADRVNKAIMPMKKLDIDALERAFAGE